MEISNKLKERFCKDCNLPIKLFEDPFFEDRLTLLDPFYNSVSKYSVFKDSYKSSGYKNEQEYFEEYNYVKDQAIKFIKGTDAFNEFNECDVRSFEIKPKMPLPSSDIYKPSNDGKMFISIDMKKANFSSLHNYNSSMFDGCPTWEDFVGKFTSNAHIINSKYIRQVILGNCNPKRHIAYEKYLTYKMLCYLNQSFSVRDILEFFSNDEAVLSWEVDEREVAAKVKEFTEQTGVEFTVTPFELCVIGENQGYYKDISLGHKKHEYKFKCVDPTILPFVIRSALGQPPHDYDRYFMFDGHLAMFAKPIEVNIPILCSSDTK